MGGVLFLENVYTLVHVLFYLLHQTADHDFPLLTTRKNLQKKKKKLPGIFYPTGKKIVVTQRVQQYRPLIVYRLPPNPVETLTRMVYVSISVVSVMMTFSTLLTVSASSPPFG